MNNKKLHLYEIMYRIRVFEKESIELYKEGEINGTIHPCIGQEAVAAGVCFNLSKDDYISSTHRGHGHCIAKGAEFGPMFAELLGREDGYCRGRGGSMHIADFSLGNLGANGIVGGGVPIAVGAALTIVYRKTDQVSVVFFGDAAINQGSFYEAANLAAAWKLPVVFICENNYYGVSMRIEDAVADMDLSKRARALGFPGKTVDGNDVEQIEEHARKAIASARKGKGPQLLVANTYRWEGHFFGDPCNYRDKEEEKSWKSRDPVATYRKQLEKEGYSNALNDLEEKVNIELKNAVEFAKNSPIPDPQNVMDNVYYGINVL